MNHSKKVECFSASKLGLGTGRLASLGAGYTRKDATSLLVVAAELGVNLIDTADSYGSTDCESLLGRLLQDFPGQFFVATKAGYPYCELPHPFGVVNQFGKKALQKLHRQPCFTESYLRKCIEGSLRRLRRDALDLFYLHDPSAEIMRQEDWRNAVGAALHAGKIRHFGISSPDPDVQALATSDPMCEVLQVPLHIGIRSMPMTTMPLVANHVFGRGLDLPEVAALARKVGCSPRSLLLAYAANRPGVSCVLSGTGRAEHLRKNVQAMRIALDDEINQRLAALRV